MDSKKKTVAKARYLVKRTFTYKGKLYEAGKKVSLTKEQANGLKINFLI